MSENIPDFLKPYPLPPYPANKETPNCCCGTEEEYQSFLISEYGAEKVLEVQRENEKSEKFWKELSENIKKNIEQMKSEKQAD